MKQKIFAFTGVTIITLGLLLLFGCGNDKRDRASFVAGCLTGVAGLAGAIGVPEAMIDWEKTRVACHKEYDNFKKTNETKTR